MASSAIETGTYMPLVIKKRKLAQPVNTLPRNRFTLVIIAPQFFYFRMGDNDPLVAQHARFHRRHTRPLGVQRTWMTEQATEMFRGNMESVTERDGLFNANSAGEEEEDRHGNGNSGQPNQASHR